MFLQNVAIMIVIDKLVINLPRIIEVKIKYSLQMTQQRFLTAIKKNCTLSFHSCDLITNFEDIKANMIDLKS